MKIESPMGKDAVSVGLNKSQNSSMIKSVENSYEAEEPQEETKIAQEKENSKTLQNDDNEDKEETKSILKRQKLTTGKKKEAKPKETIIVQKESRNPFRDFLDNLGDKGKGFADSVRKEKDELLAKLKSIKSHEEIPLSSLVHKEVDKKHTEVQTEDNGTKEEDSDYLADVMKISQLSEELTRKNEYLEKSENKIVNLKEEISEYKDQIKNLTKEISELNDVVRKLKEKEEHFIQEITDINNKVNFLQLENNMHVQQKQKFLSECPQDAKELDELKMVPRDKYSLYKKCYKQYKTLTKNMKYYERKIMLLQVRN